ncbi:MAG: bifunctional folylpolyglutamate synthase/dihydrofolate synthase [Rhizobiaceae bacterium]
MSADALIEKLSATHPKGYDLSLDRIRSVLSRLDDPHLNLPQVIHVAGTNGKGSTIAFCRAILESAGIDVHVHTSPHLVCWNERFRIGADSGGELVSDEMLEDVVERVVHANDGAPITIFEILTAAMFLLFAEHPAQCCLIETGLGGRFDATNVIENPLASIITNIALDHQSYLGDRLELIAAEKAGIIKPGCTVIIGPQIDIVQAVLEENALSKASPAIIAGQDFTFFEQGGRFVYQDEMGLLDLPIPRLAGAHQLANAASAIAALHHAEFDISESAFEKAMETVQWPGRMERLRKGDLQQRLAKATNSQMEIWIDGGHNPGAGKVIAHFLADLDERAPMPVFLIAGMLNTKDPAGYFQSFEGIAERVFTVPVPGTDAGIEPNELARIVDSTGLPVSSCLTVADALETITGLLADGEPARILICGSLYLVGDVLRTNNTLPR